MKKSPYFLFLILIDNFFSIFSIELVDYFFECRADKYVKAIDVCWLLSRLD